MMLGVLVCALVMLVPLTSVRAQAYRSCVFYQNFYSQARKVFGPVNAECSGSWHSPPFGNWGVETNLTGRLNGDQFMGWHAGDGHQEWNSCTSEYPAPNPFYYTSDGRTTQESDQGVGAHSRAMVGMMYYVPCEDASLYGTIWSTGGHYMRLYELDPGDSDEFVAQLDFPAVEVVFDCLPGACFKETGWIEPSNVSPNVVYAQMKMTILATDEYIP